MTRLVVLDTNVLVSAGISTKAPPAQIIEMVLKGELVMLTCPEVISEYVDVLTRIKFEQYGFPPFWLKGLLILAHHVDQNLPLSEIKFPDPSDVVFYELAKFYGAVLVTGNMKDFPIDKYKPVRIVTPRDYVNEFLGS